jgi:Gametolysin peptidase M11
MARCLNAFAILLAFISRETAAKSNALRGSKVQELRTLEGANEPLVCRITTVDTMIGSTSDSRSSGTEEYDACIPIINGEESHMILRISLDADLRTKYAEQVERGQLLVSVPGAFIQGGELLVPDASKIEVHEEVPEHLRHLSSLRELTSSGTVSVLVVRVSTSDGKSPAASLSEIQDQLFGDGVSMSSQYKACSRNKLNVVDAGGIDLTLDRPSGSFSKVSDLTDAAVTRLMQVRGVSNVNSLADKIFFCQPSVVGGWLAVAPVNHWRLSFNDQWCVSHSATMHEFGHSLGLLHSGKGSDDYGDESGYMGYGVRSSTGPTKCFNGIKNWQLGWFSDRAVEVSSSIRTKVNLASFVDADSTSSDQTVLVKVDGKYYIQYNRAKGMNSETGDAANKVAIVTSVSSGSRLVGQVDTSNSRFTGDNNLVIEVCSKDSSSGVESVVLSIGSSKSYCGDSIPTIGSASAESASSGEASSGLSLEAAIANAVCKAGGESCSSDAQCCGDTVCLGETSAARVCSGCLSLFETCSSNTECCGGMKCSSGLCRAG